MARMLQALKNLEARSAKTPGQGWLAHLSEKPPQPEPQSATLVMRPVVELERQSAAQVAEPAAIPTRPLRRPEVALTVPEVEAPSVSQLPQEWESAAEPMAGLATPKRTESKAAVDLGISKTTNAEPSKAGELYGRQERLPHYSRNPSSLERQVRRTLSDPVRSQPLVQLADRLRRDAEQTASKTLLFVGVGEESRAHEALLYAAALLAERPGEQVLLVDADLARRALTDGLEQGQMPGLAELLRGDGAVRERCQIAALPGLSLLPAGLLRHVDLSAAGSRLEAVLRQAAENHSLVLIDGGRSGDLAATALARLADATYFVVQLGAVETSEAQAALRDFRAASARVLGCIAT